MARWPKAIKQTGTKEESRLKTFLTSFGEVIETLDLRAESQRISEIVDNEKIFQGYHMNKDHWITIILNNSLPNDALFALIDKSFDLENEFGLNSQNPFATIS